MAHLVPTKPSIPITHLIAISVHQIRTLLRTRQSYIPVYTRDIQLHDIVLFSDSLTRPSSLEEGFSVLFQSQTTTERYACTCSQSYSLQCVRIITANTGNCLLQCSTRREQKNVFVYCTFCFISPKPTVLWTCTMHHHDPLSSLIPQSPMASCHNNNV